MESDVIGLVKKGEVLGHYSPYFGSLYDNVMKGAEIKIKKQAASIGAHKVFVIYYLYDGLNAKYADIVGTAFGYK